MAEKSINGEKSGDAATDGLVPNGDAGVQMKRDVGLIGGIAVIVGTMIGSGIFASPRYVLMFSGSVGMALVVWTLCGILAMCGALSYAELGTMIPKSGGESTYLLEAFGGLPSFMYIWTACIVIKPSQIAIVCLVFGEYVVTPFFPDCADRQEVQVIVKLLAALAIGKFV
jgi:L-type amino acid transporter 9